MKALDHTSDLQAGFLGAFMRSTVQDKKGPRVVSLCKQNCSSLLSSSVTFYTWVSMILLGERAWGSALEKDSWTSMSSLQPIYLCGGLGDQGTWFASAINSCLFARWTTNLCEQPEPSAPASTQPPGCLNGSDACIPADLPELVFWQWGSPTSLLANSLCLALKGATPLPKLRLPWLSVPQGSHASLWWSDSTPSQLI